MNTTALLVLLLLPISHLSAKNGEKVPSPKEEEKIPVLEGDPSDHYFRAWLMYRDADKLQKDNALSPEAKETYESALLTFRGVKAAWPEWKKDMVNGRIAKVEERLKAFGPAKK